MVPNTLSKRVSSKSRCTATDRVMVDHLTPGIEATGARAGVSALLVDASSVLATVGTDHTLWPTGWRTADIVGLARAHSMPINSSALAVRTTWRWYARILRLRWSNYYKRNKEKSRRRLNKSNMQERQ